MRAIDISAAIKNNFPQDVVKLFHDIVSDRRLSTGKVQLKVISGGIITIGKNFSFFSVDTEAAAASDNLDTINGGVDGDFIFIRATNDAHTVVLKHGTGNLRNEGGADLSLDSTSDLAQLHYDAGLGVWKCKLWNVA